MLTTVLKALPNVSKHIDIFVLFQIQIELTKSRKAHFSF